MWDTVGVGGNQAFGKPSHMKTAHPSYSLADCAHTVAEIIENHSPRYVAVVVTPDGPTYGFHNSGTFQAIREAVGESAACDLCADAHQGDSYQFDENFGRDVSRLIDNRGNVLAILIKA